jgi:hypothetical protein
MPIVVVPVLVMVVLVVVVLDVTALHIDVAVAPTLTPKAPRAERCVDQHEDPYQDMTESLFQVNLRFLEAREARISAAPPSPHRSP